MVKFFLRTGVGDYIKQNRRSSLPLGGWLVRSCRGNSQIWEPSVQRNGLGAGTVLHTASQGLAKHDSGEGRKGQP